MFRAADSAGVAGVNLAAPSGHPVSCYSTAVMRYLNVTIKPDGKGWTKMQ